MEQEKTSNLEKEMKRAGFAPLIREMKKKIQGKEQLLLAYSDPGYSQVKMPMLCILDIRLHGMKGEYFIHNYDATITKENKDRLSEKYITRSRKFYSRQGKVPTIQRARQLLQHDILRKQLQKEVKREQKHKNNKRL